MPATGVSGRMVAQDSVEVLQAGDTAPPFELVGVDGETHSAAAFAEDYRALLVVFTCNHCPYAQAKFDVLNDLAEDFPDLAVVGINPNDETEYPEDSVEKMREYVADGRVDYTAYLRDDDQSVAAAYGARCTPDPFLFSLQDGEWVLEYHGRLDDATNPEATPSEHYVRGAVEDILAGEPVDLEFMPARGCSIKWTPGNEPEYAD
jgi:peroxiredoxin